MEKYNLSFVKGQSYSLDVELEDADFSDSTFRMDIREEKDPDSTLVLDVDSFISVVDGIVQVDIPSDETDQLSTGSYFYDLWEIQEVSGEDDRKIPYLFGEVEVVERVSDI